MPSTRRTFLAAALPVFAGCAGRTPDEEPPTEPPTATANRRTTTDDSEPATTTDEAAAVRWTYETTTDAIETLTLAPGAGGPAVYVGSAGSGASGTEPADDGDDHALAAVALRDGREQWRVSLPNPPSTPPTHGGHDDPPRVYLATGRESLHGRGSELLAIDPTRGEREWTFDTTEDRFVYPLATSDERVFVGRRDDQLGPDGEYLYALDVDDGTERWREGAGDAADDGHAVRRGVLVVKTHRRVRAFEPTSGEERWRVEADAPIDGPVYGNHAERVFISHGDAVRGIGLEDGNDLWRRKFDFRVSRVTQPREALSTTVHVGDYDGRLLALSPLDGTTRWTYSVDREGFHPSVERTSESLFVGGAGVHCLDPVSGDRRWAFTPDVEGTVRGHASTTVFASGGGSVWALDPENGDVRWEFSPAAGIEGVLNAGAVAFVASGGTVFALDGSRTR